MTTAVETTAPSDFIRDVVGEDLRTGKHKHIHTRFPPEPNGYLHIGHAKSICLNFGIAREFGGICNIRMDDTNPTKEETEYVDSIMTDVKWLIGGWADGNLGLKQLGQKPEAITVDGKKDFQLNPIVVSEIGGDATPFYASDYFDQLYEYAVELVGRGKAYVDDMKPEEVDEYRRLGKESRFRNRSPEENLDLPGCPERSSDGEIPHGHVGLAVAVEIAHGQPDGI